MNPSDRQSTEDMAQYDRNAVVALQEEARQADLRLHVGLAGFEAVHEAEDARERRRHPCFWLSVLWFVVAALVALIGMAFLGIAIYRAHARQRDETSLFMGIFFAFCLPFAFAAAAMCYCQMAEPGRRNLPVCEHVTLEQFYCV